MSILTNPKLKYLLLLPIVILIINACYFRYANQEIQRAMLQQKLLEVTDAVNMLATAVEANPERYWRDLEANIVDSTEFLDNLHSIYSATFVRAGDTIERISERNFETDFDPLAYPLLAESVLECESGNLTVGFAPDGQPYRDLYMYFRWMPLYSGADERYLVVAGVSKYSIVTPIAVWVSAGQWASMGVTFGLNAFLVILLTRMGHIYGQRKSPCWRERWED